MDVTLFVIMGSSLIALSCFTRAVYLELKSTKEELDKARNVVKYLENELQNYRHQMEILKYGQSSRQTSRKVTQIPDFLLADDPMEALLKDVGTVKKRHD